MAERALVSDELWEAVEPLLPRRAAQPKGGRPWVSDRAVLGGIIFVLETGIAWKRLPPELGYGSGITCWRRVREWQAAGVWERLHQTILNWLGDEGAINWERASLDSTSVRAKKGAKPPGGIRPTGASSAPSTM